MLSIKNATGISITVLTLLVCLPETKSYAWWHEDHHHHESDHLHFGIHVSLLPRDCFNVWSGGGRFYYCDGYYYQRDRFDYMVVNPPVGTVLTSVPTYQPVVINGVTYYTNNGVYYIYTPQGYQVVPQPVTTIVQSPSENFTTTEVSPPADDNTFSVNIPNNKGGYTLVTIKRSGNGFIGPQGEFYSEFPKVSQLKAMYAK